MTQRARGQQHILALADRVRGLEAPIACSGEARTSAPIALRVGRRRFTLGELVSREWAPRRAIEQLERLCAKAVFGVGRETRADARVRSGKQLKATGGGLEVEGLEAILPAILEEVRAKLCPDDEEPPTAELHSLNVYPRGGHFVGHRDTPVDRDVFGTLVVCLPVAFDGGALVVRQGATHVFDWAERAFERRAAQEGATGVHRLRWAAFYGDVEHEVQRVESGHRVTLTWTLRRAGGSRTVERRVPWDDVDLEAELFRALADRGFMPRGGLLGFPCVHLYAEAVGATLADEPLGARDLGRLKGRDRLTALALVRSDLEVLFRPYVYETCAGENWRLSRPLTRDELAVFERRQLGSSALERRLPIERHGTPWEDRDDVAWVIPPPWDSAPRVDAIPEASVLGDVEYSATDYFGNEGTVTTFYVAAALLARVPPERDRAAWRG